MATATVAMPTPAAAETPPATPEKPLKAAIFSRQDTWTPPEAADDSSEEKVQVKHEEPIHEEAHTPAKQPEEAAEEEPEEEDKTKADTKEEAVAAKPEPPSIITSTPRNGPMTLTKSSSAQKAQPVAVPELTVGKVRAKESVCRRRPLDVSRHVPHS